MKGSTAQTYIYTCVHIYIYRVTSCLPAVGRVRVRQSQELRTPVSWFARTQLLELPSADFAGTFTGSWIGAEALGLELEP